MTPKVFLSCGTPYTETQEQAIKAVESYLKENGCTPCTVGRTSYSIAQPVRHVRELMRECHGAVVIAFERTRIEKGVDKPGADDERSIDGVALPTVWNQLEAAIAYTHDLPLLIIVERNVEAKGMLSDKLEWHIHRADLSPALIDTPEFRGIFEDWKRRVFEHEVLLATPRRDVVIDGEKLTLGDLIKSLSVKQFWGVLSALAAVLAAVATAAYVIGTNAG